MDSILTTAGSSLLAYIDPGMASMAIQAFFALLFGSITAWMLAPWRAVKSFFMGQREPSESSDA